MSITWQRCTKYGHRHMTQHPLFDNTNNNNIGKVRTGVTMAFAVFWPDTILEAGKLTRIMQQLKLEVLCMSTIMKENCSTICRKSIQNKETSKSHNWKWERPAAVSALVGITAQSVTYSITRPCQRHPHDRAWKRIFYHVQVSWINLVTCTPFCPYRRYVKLNLAT